MEIEDSQLRRVFETKREQRGLNRPIVEPLRFVAADVPCRQCGKTVVLHRVAGSKRPLGKVICKTCRDVQDEHRRQEARASAAAEREARLQTMRANMREILAGCGVPEHWRGASLGKCQDLPSGLIETVRRWAELPVGFIFLCGQPGAGKTYLATALMGHMLGQGYVESKECRYIGERAYLSELKDGFGSEIRPSSPRLASPNHVRRATLLLYDDLGSERQTDWARNEVAALLEARHAEDLATIITSNLDLNTVAKVIDGRLASRIAEGRMILEFPGKDLRMHGTTMKGVFV